MNTTPPAPEPTDAEAATAAQAATHNVEAAGSADVTGKVQAASGAQASSIADVASNAEAASDAESASNSVVQSVTPRWTDADSAALDEAMHHPSLMDGPLTEMIEGFITGTVVSPFEGKAEHLLAPLLSLYEIDLDVLEPEAREPLLAIVQKRMDCVLEELEQVLSTPPEQEPAYGYEPLLTDWSSASAPEGAPPLPLVGELWAVGLNVARLAWREEAWDQLDKHGLRALERIYRPILQLAATGKEAVRDTRQREHLLVEAESSVYDAYVLTEEHFERLAVTPEPLVKAIVPGRNDPCSCGSGKKYKKCCGA